METITLTKQEYHRKMFESYKEGFKSAIETLQSAFVAVEEAAQQSVQRTGGEPCLFHNIIDCEACRQLDVQSSTRA